MATERTDTLSGYDTTGRPVPPMIYSYMFRQALSHCRNLFSVKELAQQLRWYVPTHTPLRKACNYLVRTGILQRVTHGVYRRTLPAPTTKAVWTLASWERQPFPMPDTEYWAPDNGVPLVCFSCGHITGEG